MAGSPTIRRRRLSAELIRLREAAGLGVEEAGKRLEWSRGRLTHMEQNKWVRPDLGNIKELLDLYGIDDSEQREAILRLARESRQRGWWADYKDVFRGSLPGFEAEARVVRTYEGLAVPGLLQTEGYIAAIFRAGQVLSAPSIERHVQARLTRQAILTRDDPPQLWAVIDEAALRKHVGGVEVMSDQLRHLIEYAARPNITIQVLPDSVGAHAAMWGSFMILDFGELDPSIVYLETASDSLYLEKPDELAHYTLMYSRVLASALSPEASVQHMATIVDQLTR